MCEITFIAVSAIFSPQVIFAELGFVLANVVDSWCFGMLKRAVMSFFAVPSCEVFTFYFMGGSFGVGDGIGVEVFSVLLEADGDFFGWRVVPQNIVKNFFVFG